MAFSSGSKAEFKLGAKGGSLTDITDYANESSFTKEIEALETTTFKKTAKTYIPGLKDATSSLGGLWDETFDAVMAPLEGVMCSFEYYPNTSATGKVKYSGDCLITSYEIDNGLGDANAWSADLQVSGEVARDLVA